MFRAIILPIFRNTRLCVAASGTMHPRCCRPATSWVHYTTSCNTQSSVPVDGRNNRPKHVELIWIINKLLLLYLVGCVYYLYQWCTVKQISHPERILVKPDAEVFYLHLPVRLSLFKIRHNKGLDIKTYTPFCVHLKCNTGMAQYFFIRNDKCSQRGL